MNSKLNRLKLWRKLGNPHYRKAFVSSTIAARLAIRIFNLRKKADWSQEQLAKEAGTKQARISLLEQGDYEDFSFNTIKKIAAAFNVAVIVDFVSFPDFEKWSESFSSESVAPDSFAESIKHAGLISSKPSIGQIQKGPLSDQDELPLYKIIQVLLASHGVRHDNPLSAQIQ